MKFFFPVKEIVVKVYKCNKDQRNARFFFYCRTSQSHDPLQFMKAMRNTRDCIDFHLWASRLQSENLFVILLSLLERKYMKNEYGHFKSRMGKHLSFSGSKVDWIDGSTEFKMIESVTLHLRKPQK